MTMTPEQFIMFLHKYCQEQIKGEANHFEREHGKDEAYKDVMTTIRVYVREFCNSPALKQKEQVNEKH